MTIAYGLVGILDDILQWRRLRKWQKKAELSVMPTNLVLSIASTLTSRLLQLVPGLMFGTPKALHADETSLDEEQHRKLSKLSTLTVVSLGSILWLLTILTTGVQRLNLPPAVRNITGGLEGFFLIVSAVSLENIFIQLLGFPGGFGEALRKKNRILWVVVLVLVTFLFYHSLINPRGELAEAIRSSNVILFFIVLALFLLTVFGIWLYYRRQDRKKAPNPVMPVMEIIPPAAALISPTNNTPFPINQEDQGQQTAMSGLIHRPITLEIHSLGAEKTCPACGQEIKAEARLCRYCRAQFVVHLRGYCLHDHAVVNILEPNLCSICGCIVEDVHVESKLV